MQTKKTIRIGIIGCGKISNAYFKGSSAFEVLETIAFADINMAAAQAKATEHGCKAQSVEELLANKDKEHFGAADMAYAILSGRSHRASGELAYHVLEIMQAFEQASDAGQRIDIQSHPDRPAPLPLGLISGRLDP